VRPRQSLLLGTGICLIAQRAPIQTARQVASIDQVSASRLLFGVGNGWNEDEMANHGTAFASRHKLARASPVHEGDPDGVKGRVSSRVRELRADDGLAEAGPQTASADHRRRRLPVWRAAGPARRQRLDASQHSHPVCGCAGLLPKFPTMAAEAGRDPASVPITIWGVKDLLKRERDDGVSRLVVSFDSGRTDRILPELDCWATLIRQLSS
jgi:alkanesulfonate monooxygenase SsuD/methylene tetrahydromethanopterin reductase-like flavin-dependent oxidoreductase (luciferase family)